MNGPNNSPLRSKISLLDNIISDSKRLVKLCKDNNLREAKLILSTTFINLEQQDEAGCTAFHYACINEDKEMLDALLNKYIYPQHLMEEYSYHETENFICLQDKNDNKTILHYICEKNLIEFYNKLEIYFPHKTHSAINHVTNNGDTALHLACKNSSNEVLEKIIKIPTINVNSVNNDKNTALHIACQHNYLSIVQVLLLHPHININIKNDFGDAPLHMACKSNNYGSILIVEELLRMKSINVDLENNQRLSPLRLATEQTQYEIAALLKYAKRI